MKPILFSSDATTFTSNGIGRLDCIDCIVTEERNGQFDLELTIAEGSSHASEIQMSSIILAVPRPGSTPQPFRVYNIQKPINGRFTVYAQHISYQLSFIPCMPFTVLADSTACASTLAALKTNSAEDNPFTFWTDVTTVASYTQTTPASIRSRLGGVQGSVLDCFGGELEWDGYTVKLHQNRGIQTPTVSLRYGKNITDINQEENISNTITGVCPFWADSEGSTVVTLTEKVVESEYADNYPYKRTVPLDLSQEFEAAPTENELKAKAEAYLDGDGIGVPTVSIKVSFIDLADTEEYKDIAQLQSVKLCDKVSVQFEKLGISAVAKVVKTVFDVLKERYNSIEIGSVKASLAQTISDTNGAIETTLDKALFATKNATQWLTGSNGYVMAVKNDDGSWKELLFLDTNDAETATNVIRINENGIGFSRNGVSGPYQQAWTMDGRLVIGGTNVPSMTITDANGEVGILNSSGLQWFKSGTTNPLFSLTSSSIGGSFQIYDPSTNANRSVANIYAAHQSSGRHDMRIDTRDPDGNDSRLILSVSQDNHTYDFLYHNYSDAADGKPPYIMGGMTANVQVAYGTSTRTLKFENGIFRGYTTP